MAQKAFDKLLDKATSPLLFEIDWESVLSMCDMIRGGDLQGKYAVDKIKKKLTNENNNVINFSLTCLESFVKNCGSKVHQEVATKDTMDLLRNLVATKPDVIKNKVLELVQCWAHAFKKNPNYKIVDDYYNLMKLDGVQYPKLKESEAMFDVEEAPMWKEDTEATSCFKCRTNFSTFNRKHHCRACGEIFCGACSAKTSAIPKFGIEKEVRVCDACYDKIRGLTPSSSQTMLSSQQAENSEGLPLEYVNSPLYKEGKLEATKKPQEKTEQEFEEELQLALALSQSEEEEKQRRKSGGSSSSAGKALNGKNSKSKEDHKSAFDNDSSQSAFPKLSQFQNQNSSFQLPYASAPSQNDSGAKSAAMSKSSSSDLSKNGTSILASSGSGGVSNGARYDEVNNLSNEEINMNNEIDEFVEELKKILELYINRMKSDSMRGRSITNDTAVQSLFLQLQHYHPRLLQYIKYQEDARGHYENLQDKLTQLKDAREALNALRHENQEKKRIEAEERERIRQIQIAQKLQFMRQQKQTYYQYQSQLNLQRLQEQERESQLRLEQQRQLAMKRDQQLLTADGLGYQQNLPGMDGYNSMAGLPGMPGPYPIGLNGQGGQPPLGMGMMPNMNQALGYPSYNMVPPQQQLPQSNSQPQLVQNPAMGDPQKAMLGQYPIQQAPQQQQQQQFQQQVLPGQIPPQTQWNQSIANPVYQQQQQQLPQEQKPVEPTLQLQQQYQQAPQMAPVSLGQNINYPAPSQTNGIVAPPAPAAEAQLISFD